MGWGEVRGPVNDGAGTTGQIELAPEALGAVGIPGGTLAQRAIAAAGRIDTLAAEIEQLRDLVAIGASLATDGDEETYEGPRRKFVQRVIDLQQAWLDTTRSAA